MKKFCNPPVAEAESFLLYQLLKIFI